MSGKPAVKPNYLRPGTVIGAYRVEEQIGGGGFGFVYQVERDGRPYALKIGQARLSDLPRDERTSTVERLEREVAALMSLHHANIVRVHSFERWPDLEGGFPYLVMDYVEGTSLQEWRAAARPALARVVRLFEKITGALDHMHQVGIIHRDLKSANIVVRFDGEPFVVDFGIARPLVAHDVTRAAGVGTLTHLAPEYAKYLDSAEAVRGSAFDWRPTTDLYALGYVLYEALTCEPPVPRFPELGAREEAELLNAIKNTVPRRPRELEPLIPQVIDDLVMQLLEKDPRKRPQSAGEVMSRLREAREAGEQALDPAWAHPLDLPAGESGDPHASPVPAGSHDVVAPLDAPDEPGPDAPAQSRPAGAPAGAEPRPAKPKPPAPPRARAAQPVALPTTARSPAYVGGDEVPPAESAAKVPDGWGRESQILKRVAAEWTAANPKPRRWRVALAAGGGILAVLVVVLVASQWATEPPRPQTLLRAVESGAGPASPPLPPPPVTQPAAPAEKVEPATGSAEPGRPAPRPAAGAGARAASNPDARAIDEDLEREYGRPTVLPDGRLVSRPEAGPTDPGGLLRSRPLGAEPSGLLRSRQLDPEKSATVPASRGVVFGSHIQARLLTNLDSRTIGNGPVEAMLHVPFIVRGQVLLPTRTMVYGTATESGGRFTIRFTRMRLPDDTEVAFEGIALARDDGKPGLAASGRVGQEPKRGEGLGTKVAKGTGNLLLDTVSGGIGHDIVRGAGQAALNHEEPQSASAQWALLLDAGVAFDVFVERSF